ncbi:endo-1,6-alpha-mannosidase [Mycena olivaceomarginata]|nr:endo-1,6-alpha-mannosidase [Mycena olivaceomarginata]
MQLLHLTLVSLVSLVAAQDLGVPLSCGYAVFILTPRAYAHSEQKFSNTRPIAERITIAQNAINQMTPQLNAATGEFNGIGYWQSGNVWSVLANQDHLAGTTTNKALVVNNLNLVWWAQAALYGYRAYADTNLLAHAVDVWTHVTGYVITPAQASARKNPNKAFTLESTCGGATMAGGVFWQTSTSDQSVNSITTGLYITLSAFLAEYTKNATYTAAAIQSANWIKAHNINANDLVLDTVNAFDCSTSPASWLFTYNSGKYIEGLSVLQLLQAILNGARCKLPAINILNAAVKTTAWEGADGIITEGVSTTSNNDGLGLKYNALLTSPRLAARIPNWHGPPQAFTSWGQLAALGVDE